MVQQRTRPSRSSSASKRTTSKKAAPRARLVAGHEADLFGLASVVLGILMALGIYADLTGPLGRGLEAAGGGLLGVGRFALPLLLVALGVALIRGIDADEETGRWLACTVLAVLAVEGLLHLTQGPEEL